MRLSPIIAAACALLSKHVGADQSEEETVDLTILELAQSDPDNFSILLSLVDEADLAETLSSEGPFTLFAPTNDAFDEIPDEFISFWREDGDALKNVLMYHVLNGAILSTDLVDGGDYKTLEGSDLHVHDMGGVPEIGNEALDYFVNITEADVTASNGVIHIINGVLITEDILELLEELFDDEEESFDNEDDEEQFFDDETGDLTILQLGQADPDNFSILLSLVDEADLAEALSSEGPFTLFAPTNDAFGEVPDNVISFLQEDGDALKNVLMYHVLSGAISSTDLDDGGNYTTLEGSDLHVHEYNGGYREIGNHATGLFADIIEADVTASNGVIHVIEDVLIPEDILELLEELFFDDETDDANGEAVCEGKGYNQETCESIGDNCCHYNQSDGQCWSSIGQDKCQDDNTGTEDEMEVSAGTDHGKKAKKAKKVKKTKKTKKDGKKKKGGKK